jgi:hypothetical protein
MYACVMALPYYGYRFGVLGSGSSSLPYHSAASPISALGTIATGTQTLYLATPPIAGAVAYAWFAGSTGSAGTAALLRLEAITPLATCKLTTLIGTNALISTVTNADTTVDGNDYDGILTQVWGGTAMTSKAATYPLTNGTLYAASSGAPFVMMSNGVLGVGAGLTADNAGGVAEIDQLLKYLWDQQRLGPATMWVNAQENKNLVAKVTAGTGNMVGYAVQLSPDGGGGLKGGFRVTSYLNKATGQDIAIKVHPTLPPGTILFETESLPYPNANVPNVMELEVLQEYAMFDWARTQRSYPFGIYGHATLKNYMPAAFGIITNIADA